jgi:hypothetical protein
MYPEREGRFGTAHSSLGVERLRITVAPQPYACQRDDLRGSTRQLHADAGSRLAFNAARDNERHPYGREQHVDMAGATVIPTDILFPNIRPIRPTRRLAIKWQQMSRLP